MAIAAIGWSASACAARPRPLSTAALATQTAAARPTAEPASGEATPVTAMGVQFLGAAQIGWARLLLDGQEVWRGKTAELGHTLDQYGGYVEVSGFDPGEHSLRVESLGWDYRPVAVASFGFRFSP